MQIKDYMELIQYRITEGSEYCWSCFGENAYCIDSWNGEQNGYSASIVFDTKTQVVYQVEASDYNSNKAYRWINPEFVTQYLDECRHRSVDPAQAWDEATYIDLDEHSFLRTAVGIVRERSFLYT